MILEANWKVNSRKTMQQYFIFLPKVTAATCVWSAPIVNPLTMLTINSITRPQLSGPFGGFVSRMLPEQSTRNAISSLHSTKIPNMFWHHRMRCLSSRSFRQNECSQLFYIDVQHTCHISRRRCNATACFGCRGCRDGNSYKQTDNNDYVQHWLFVPKLP